MNKNTLTIYEFERKKLPEWIQRETIFKLEKLNNDLKRIQKTGTDVLRVEYFRGKAENIVASSYVGVIKVGTVSFQILPKLSKDTDDTHKNQCVRNLLYMLEQTKRLQIKETEMSQLSQVHDDIFEVLVYLFAKNLLQIVRRGFHKEYVQHQDSLGFVKGKIVFNSKENFIYQHKFDLLYDEFQEDTLLNRVLKYCIVLLQRNSKNVVNVKMLQELSFIFNEVSLKQIHPEDFNHIHLTYLNKQYEPVLNLARLFISQSSLELSSGDLSTFSFLFDMNTLFEEFLGETIKQEFSTDFSAISLQKPSMNFVEQITIDTIIRNGGYKLRPDIQLYKEKFDKSPSLIIDTKYKRINSLDDISQQDLYQMFAYSQKYSCKEILLLYPKIGTGVQVKLDVSPSCCIQVRTIDLGYDLKQERGRLRKALRGIVLLENGY